MGAQNWFGRHRRGLVRKASAAVLLAMLFFGACVFLSMRAEALFARAMEERDLFPGRVTAEAIRADFLGDVEADGIRWTMDDGTVLADIPSVRFHVKPWDVVTGHIGTMSVTDVDMEKAYVHLFFDERMRPLYVKPGRKERQEAGLGPIRLTGAAGNRLFDCRVTFRDGTIEAESPDRHFRLEHVDLRLDADTKRRMEIDLLTGPFEGTVAAERLALHGVVDFTERRPSCDMALSISGCRPSSLGAGLDIDDPVSLSARVEGPVARPVIEGQLSIPVLSVPALRFTKLTGDFHYEDGGLSVSDVKGEVYGGTVEGRGEFDLDRRTWTAEIRGHQLRGGLAARDLRLRCEVELDMHLAGDGSGPPEAWGTFVSGEGKYHLLPFEKITGAFDREGDRITIRDVVISLAMGDVTTNAFTIEDGHVHLGPIYLMDALSGSTSRVY